MNTNKKRKFWLFLLFPVLLFAITGIVMLLWNALLPEILGVKTINFWQAMGILVLSKILFGGFHGKGGKKFGHHHANHAEGEFPEEKEKLRKMWKERFKRYCDKQ